MSTMNHGIISWEADQLGCRIWDFAMGEGTAVGMYTSRGLADSEDVWRDAYVPTRGEPLRFGAYEYARYEPAYEQPFLDMCLRVHNFLAAVVVPAATSDREAMAVLTAYDSVSPDVRRRIFDIPAIHHPPKRRKRSEQTVRDLIQPIPLPCEWAYLLSFFYPRPITLFLARDEQKVRDLESVRPDSYYYEAGEKW